MPETADGDQDAISNTELSSMYSDKSPMKKKPRREDVEDHLQRFLFAEDQQNNGIFDENDIYSFLCMARPLPCLFLNYAKLFSGNI